MSKSDQWVTILIVGLILVHLMILITGFVFNKLLYLTTLLNVVAGLFILIYWIQKQVRIQQHLFELREILVLCFEVAVVGCAGYAMMYTLCTNWLKFTQYIVFGIHVAALLFFLVFMVTFKMQRLV